MKSYALELKVVGPLFVGSGRSIGKKEYIFQKQTGTVFVPDEVKMYAGLRQKHLERQFQDYLLGPDNRTGLGLWMRDNRVSPAEYSRWIKYSMEGGDRLQSGKPPAQIETFQKDSYGQPYVPGSTIKGMLRSLLLTYELVKEPERFRENRSSVYSNSSRKAGRMSYLSGDIKSLEEKVLHTLERHDYYGKPVRKKDAVNDCLSGLIVGDSESLSVNNLTLCQKMDRSRDGNFNNSLNTLREALKPGTSIPFLLTIDETVCGYTIGDLMAAVRKFSEIYYEMYLKYFSGTDRPTDRTVWLGGGTGFFTKTIVYPLMGRNQGLDVAINVFDQTLPGKIKERHKHYLDRRTGISPHMLKCTEYKGKIYQMGMCELRIKQEML